MLPLGLGVMDVVSLCRRGSQPGLHAACPGGPLPISIIVPSLPWARQSERHGRGRSWWWRLEGVRAVSCEEHCSCSVEPQHQPRFPMFPFILDRAQAIQWSIGSTSLSLRALFASCYRAFVQISFASFLVIVLVVFLWRQNYAEATSNRLD